MPRKLPEPRFVKPEMVDIGDTIRVTYQPSAGIEVSKVGTVAERQEHGACRFLMTAEGGQLLVWEPGGAEKVRVTLLNRPERAQVETLFDLPTEADLPFIGEVRQRIS